MESHGPVRPSGPISAMRTASVPGGTAHPDSFVSIRPPVSNSTANRPALPVSGKVQLSALSAPRRSQFASPARIRRWQGRQGKAARFADQRDFHEIDLDQIAPFTGARHPHFREKPDGEPPSAGVQQAEARSAFDQPPDKQPVAILRRPHPASRPRPHALFSRGSKRPPLQPSVHTGTPPRCAGIHRGSGRRHRARPSSPPAARSAAPAARPSLPHAPHVQKARSISFRVSLRLSR